MAETEDGTIAGFAYCFPAHAHGEVFLHSDMLAVRPRFRGTGLGQALKWAQREHALLGGIKRITWTFDPMQAGNAHLNLELLGVTVREYLDDFYGVTSSALHHGLPTDRLLASWDLEAPQVTALATGKRRPATNPAGRIAIPEAWNDLVRRDLEAASAEHQRVRLEMKAAFAKGQIATGFDKTSSTYLLRATEGP